MDQPAGFRIERAPTQGAGTTPRVEAASDGDTVVALTGDWTAQSLGRAGERLAVAVRSLSSVALDLAQLGRLDSAGAYVLMQAAKIGPQTGGISVRPDVERLVAFISTSMTAQPAGGPRRVDSVYAFLVRIGQAVLHLGSELARTLVFYGHLLVALGRVLANPKRIRIAPTVSLMERAGLDALPIVATTNFFVGATIGFLGAQLLQQFGAQVYSVELIGIGVLREFAILVTAIILAGRSASSFAAEIGAMKMNQEVDAMQVMGVDAFEALVLPRFIAMLTMTPLLTFAAMISGLCGGMVVIWTVVGLSPAFFLQRLLDNVGVVHFWIGMCKAPVMAVVIASIGCRQGMEVGGDVEQLGRRVTTAVVQALFSIIILDAVFALLFQGVGT